MSRRLVLTAAALAAAVVLWLVVLWRPQTASIADAEARIDAAQSANVSLEVQARSLRAARDEADALASEWGRLADLLPTEPLLGEILLEIHDVARATGVDVRALQPAKPVPAGTGVSEIGMSLSAVGGYDSTLAFVERLGSMRRLVVVDALDLAAPPETPSVLTASIRARLFVRGGS